MPTAARGRCSPHSSPRWARRSRGFVLWPLDGDSVIRRFDERRVLRYAERPPRKGLYFVDNWMGHLTIFPGYVAAGANLVMFQLGGGGVAGRTLLEGSPSVVAPFLWCTANPRTYAAATDSIDFYSGTVVEGRETPDEVGERLYRTVIDIASGTLSRSETL